MNKPLHDATKEELIAVIQDYQEMVDELTEVLNKSPKSELMFKLREIIGKWVWGDE